MSQKIRVGSSTSSRSGHKTLRMSFRDRMKISWAMVWSAVLLLFGRLHHQDTEQELSDVAETVVGGALSSAKHEEGWVNPIDDVGSLRDQRELLLAAVPKIFPHG